ncbi:hypothetical protein DM860_011592 [Cuscuta australis]|uniref:Uncharacterized protein n=1 Tax=Cuscuta australis TaxID=267555 RepID=A0A328D0X1_9ASTE|nr:hypothetical protein DM860_011592 [Cuscuta australis]
MEERTSNYILRRSIFAFLQSYKYFTITAALLAFPYAASLLLLQSLTPSSSFVLLLRARIRALFNASGFPPNSILERKLPETIAVAVLALPSSLSSSIFSKASVIHALHTSQDHPKNASSSRFFELYAVLIHTQICNSLFTLSTYATCFSSVFLAFNLADGFGVSGLPGLVPFLSATVAVLSSFTVSITFIICPLALIITGVEKTGGFMAALSKACGLVKGRTETALWLSVWINAVMAAVEALFQYRVVRGYHDNGETGIFSVAMEGMFIAYLYSVVLVLETIVAYFFISSGGSKWNIAIPY